MLWSFAVGNGGSMFRLDQIIIFTNQATSL